MKRKGNREGRSLSFLQSTPLYALLLCVLCLPALIPALFLSISNSNAITQITEAIYTQGLAAGFRVPADFESGDMEEALEIISSQTEVWRENYKYTMFLLTMSEQELLYSDSYNLDKNYPFPLPTKVLSDFLSIDKPEALAYTDLYRGQLIIVAAPVGESFLMVSVFPVSQFGLVRNSFQLNLIIFFSALISLTALGCYLLHRYVKKPLNELLFCMRNQGSLDHIEPYIGWNNEVGKLAFSYYSRETAYALNLSEISRMNEQKRKSELDVLQNQINSHFIYNTLNNIQWLAQAGRTQDVIDTVQALDLLLRGLSHSTDDLVTLEEELTYCEAYLRAQEIRFGELFSFSFDVDPLLLQMKVPKFILQPIVENSIYHGFIDGERASGMIEVAVRRRGPRIDINVYDDGAGIEKRRIRDVLKNEHKSSSRYMGVAMGNINRRIKLLCGREYGIGIDSILGEYTNVQITLPITI